MSCKDCKNYDQYVSKYAYINIRKKLEELEANNILPRVIIVSPQIFEELSDTQFVDKLNIKILRSQDVDTFFIL